MRSDIPFKVGAAVELPKPEDRLAERILPEAAVQKIIHAARNERDHALLRLLYGAGLRVSEAASLRWRNLQQHKDAGVVSVQGEGSKSARCLFEAETWSAVSKLRGGDIDEAPCLDHKWVAASLRAEFTARLATRALLRHRDTRTHAQEIRARGISLSSRFKGTLRPTRLIKEIGFKF